MPHIIVEYTDTMDVDIPCLLHDLHHDLGARESVNLNLISSRAVPLAHTIVGADQQSNKMVHITLKLFAGRSEQLRHEMTQGLQNTARNHISDDTVSITVDAHEMNKSTYQMN